MSRLPSLRRWWFPPRPKKAPSRTTRVPGGDWSPCSPEDVALLAVAGWLVFGGSGTAPAASPPSTTTATTMSVQSTTVSPTTQAPPTTRATESEPDPTAGPVEFRQEWNRHARTVADGLTISEPIPGGEFTVRFNDYLSLTGRFDDGRVSYTVLLDPAGPAATDRLGIQAMGVAIAVAAPSLDGPGRAAILADLGFDVRNPSVEGVGGSLVRDGVVYRLEFSEGLLRFTVEPATRR
ncbi:MAG: hypothetical protein KatS3mg011_0662 [Acidimicrobiia bacterium]|nr:MAG: hypothetical protein KatS3mg011_0662 [Acidimicrobiia bacterium]